MKVIGFKWIGVLESMAGLVSCRLDLPKVEPTSYETLTISPQVSGQASYLEVLTAQESLLSSQLNEAMNMYNGAQAVVALYIALGGSIE